ncbi:MAG: hypothetical protein A2504_00820 [Bdellovibrionales bacterium RIFOXYD12_FULL_39_22]|nr:MAG: hypothetical protein A2385_03440 [Bdellovibrionales bacterium RIFOXYB1_FULL_39_21]OFZ42619.1 MAG: hypothetical protein A2485_09865 [Bdellovibrionales bacterium RIFOXYC12_FULL_39_17]OFZ47113.1 MAG: hypothetical protein A2404_15430 [Bdellovibrionales bacterium RIFOXYC1_FULL_39_130]OFZ75361.1 MAG: hypothetical protein A2560_14205 [Bdellovibrionales bacterium RIFOXYD1_FULL_39_84]OFZ93312.1 MAG: hypothetical protein A2504_00820 [Bdellovibrionales bacterium RIFOXYD12_FULL_39_22]HLE10012.1 fe
MASVAIEYNAKVIGKMEFAPGNFILKVAPVGWELPEFIPGQYGVLGLNGSAGRSPLSDIESTPAEADKLIRRAYSVASSSTAKDHLEFYISMVRSGALTPRLYNLQLGDKLWMGKKFVGMFTLENIPQNANVVLIATGTGLAPYMSMLRTLVTKNNGLNNRKYAVIHGARHSWDLGYQAELQTLERISENFSYIPVVSSPEEELSKWAGATGFVEDVWKGRALGRKWGSDPTPQDTHVYLCGNPLMIESALKFLGAEKFVKHTKSEEGQIHLEEFW